MDLLTALVERAGRLVTKGELIACVWPSVTVGEDNLKANMMALRRVLGEGPDSIKYIATTASEGYQFVAPVLVGESSALTPVPMSTAAEKHNLPIAATRIVGRVEAIASIRQELSSTQLLSVVGAGGIGKSTVARAVAEQAIGSFRDGVWLVDFAPLREPTRVPSMIAAAIGLRTESADVLRALGRFLGDRETLLVLDNCEHMTDAVGFCVDSILTGAAGTKIIATGQEPLRIRGERVHRLPGLATPPPSSNLDVESALAFSAVQLFVDRATDRVGSFKLSDADAPIVGEICRRLDGVALAIELAAMHIDAFGVDGLQRQLDDRFRLLAGRRGGLERHRALVAALDWSFRLLPTQEAALLQAVSVYSGRFELSDALAVANATTTRAAESLADLADKSFLTVDVDSDGIGYRIPETIRVYCLEKSRYGGKPFEDFFVIESSRPSVLPDVDKLDAVGPVGSAFGMTVHHRPQESRGYH